MRLRWRSWEGHQSELEPQAHARPINNPTTHPSEEGRENPILGPVLSLRAEGSRTRLPQPPLLFQTRSAVMTWLLAMAATL